MLIGGFPCYDCDDELLEQVQADGRSRIRLYRLPGVRVVLGRGSRAADEVDLQRCRADGVEVVRRRGGGCSVVIDPGNLVVSTAIPLGGLGDNGRYLKQLSQWLLAGLRAIGIDGIEHNGICDLVYRGRKVSGSCLYRPRGLLYYSASLLVNAQLSLVERYLRHPPREPKYRDGRSHLEFVANLATSSIPSAEKLQERLGAVLAVPTLD